MQGCRCGKRWRIDSTAEPFHPGKARVFFFAGPANPSPAPAFQTQRNKVPPTREGAGGEADRPGGAVVFRPPPRQTRTRSRGEEKPCGIDHAYNVGKHCGNCRKINIALPAAAHSAITDTTIPATRIDRRGNNETWRYA